MIYYRCEGVNFPCSLAEHFVVDAGEFFVIGVSPTRQDRTCVSGQACNLDELRGNELTASNQFALLDTCGAAGAPQRTPACGQTSSVTASGAVVTWGADAISAAGGKYRLCWCSGVGAEDCSVPSQFRADAGLLTLVGPTPLSQDRTCISGQTCVINWIDPVPRNDSFLLRDVSAVRVRQHSGNSDNNVASFMVQIGPTASGPWTDVADAAFSPQCDLDTRFQEFAFPQYYSSPYLKLVILTGCTPSTTGAVAPQFRDLELLNAYGEWVADAGWVLGGSTSATAGLFDSDETTYWNPGDDPDDWNVILGNFAFHDNFLVLETCGLGAYVEGFPHSAATVEPLTGSLGITSPPAMTATTSPWFTLSWGTAHVSASGGQYRLCWCMRDFTCSVAGDFRVDVGRMDILGPRDSEHTCVSGQLCTFEGITGYGLSANDAVLPLDTCGVVHSTPAPYRLSYGMASLGDSPVVGSIAQIGTQIVTMQGGEYRICWCSGINYGCSTTEDFRTDAGKLMLVGPAPHTQDRTCVAGQTCLHEGIVGKYVSDEDRILVLDTCAVGSAFRRFPVSGTFVTAQRSGALISWGTALSTAAGGLYRLCWCAASSFDCALAEHYTVDLGSMAVVGPSPHSQDRTCVAGAKCELAPVHGLGLAGTDAWLALDTCGVTSHHLLPSNPQVLSLMGGSPYTKLVSEDFVTARGGEYRLCWCAGTGILGTPHTCSAPEHFGVDAGTFTIVGPAPLAQTRTCVAGQPCYLDGIIGNHLSILDYVEVLDTCGVPSVVPRFPGHGSASLLFSSGAAVSWGVQAVTAAGGNYQLCWCAKGRSQFTCNQPEDFRAHIGSLLLIGVSPLTQDRTCVSGQICVLQGILGEFLSSSNSIAVLDTCATHSPLGGFPDSGIAPLTSSGQAQWAGTALTAAGGQYRLCWCSGVTESCSVYEDFNTDMGRLTLVGVVPGQDRTCVSGLTCYLDGIQGQHLLSEDQYAVLDTCGEPHAVHRLPSAGLATAVSASGAQLSWGSNVVTAAGGQYQLCWCAGDGYDCGTSAHFRVPVGRLTIVGVSPLTQARTCVSGQTCAIEDIQGQDLSIHDRVMVLDTCGVGLPLRRFVGNEAFAAVRSSGAAFHWGTAGFTGAGGEYRLCWCSNIRQAIAGDPALGWDVASGPCVKTADGCITSDNFVEDYDNDQKCEITVQQPLLGSVSAVAFKTESGLDKLIINGVEYHGTSVTGPQAVTPTATIIWTADVSATKSGWKLCPDNTGGKCAEASEFAVDAGTFTLLGPQPLEQDRTCVAGRACSLDGLTGSHLPSARLVVLDTCAVASALPRFGHGVATASTGSGALVSWGAASVTAAGGRYRLCWCAGEPFACTAAEDFNVDAGRMTLVGPSPMSQDRTCVSGRTCFIDGIVGQDLSPGDQLLLLDTCGRTGEVSDLVGLGVSATDPARWEVQLTSASGSQYRLCWCAGPAANCGNSGEHRLDVGGLTIVGPTAFLQDRTCVSGRTCVLDGFVGQDLAGESSMLVLDTCGLSSVPHKFPNNGLATIAASGTQAGWTAAAITAAGGQYRLCWCSTDPSNDNLCSTAVDHRVDMGGLTLIGVSPLSQARTCVSGQTCEIDGLVGQHLSLLDQVLALDTCGTHAVVERFASLGGVTALMGTGAVASFGAVAATAAGGQYRLCWCAGHAGPCSNLLDFATDMGELRVLGLSPLRQDRTCISGRRCELDRFTGQDMSVEYAVMILDTCGVDSALHRSVSHGQALSVTASGGMVSWGVERMTAAGGQYRLCWCIGAFHNCEVNENFRTDGGQLTLIGPSPLSQERTCVAGMTCTFEHVVGQNVGGLPDVAGVADMVVAADTCGARSVLPRFVPTASAVASDALSGAMLTWGALAMTGAGGQYRLCWCFGLEGGGSECLDNDFPTDFGRLTVVGMFPLSQDRTCVAGMTCELAGFRGTGLSGSDMLWILDTCGVDATVPRLTDLGKAYLSGGSGARATWDAAPFTAAGGLYRLCWCAGLVGGDLRCSVAESFRVDVGALTLVGVSPLRQDRTCTAGQLCTVDSITGVSLSDADEFLILETCGVAGFLSRTGQAQGSAVVSASGSMVSWSAIITAAGRNYRLCWCPGNLLCEAEPSFTVDAGGLTLLGPTPLQQHRTCISGVPCTVDALEGFSLAPEDAIMVLDTCGTDSALSRFPLYSDSSTVFGLTLSGGETVSAAGGVYRLCWCGGAFACSQATGFRVDIGGLTLIGPSLLSQDRTCVSGQACDFDNIVGQDLTVADKIAVLDTCGGATAVPRLSNVGLFDAAHLSEARLSAGPEPVTVAGGTYRMCWCHGGNTCSVPEEFSVDVGQLTLIGVSPLSQDRTCVAGKPCELDGLTGQDLSSSDRVFVLDTCGVDSALPRMPTAGLRNP